MMHAYVNQVEPRLLGIILALLFVLAAVAMFTYVLKPKITEYRQISFSQENLERVVQRGTALDGELAALRDMVTALEHRFQGDAGDLPAEAIEAHIIGGLQNVAWNTQVELIAVQPEPGKRVSIFEEIAFELHVAGSYFDLFRWLSALDRELGFLVVKHYVIDSDEGDKGDDRLKMRLNMAAYRIVEP